MASFEPFSPKFPSKPKPTQPKNTFINHKTHLYQLTTFIIGFFLHNLDKKRFMVVPYQGDVSNLCRFHTLTFLLFLFFLLPLCFSSFSFPSLHRICPIQKPKMRYFWSKIRPCLALSHFCLNFSPFAFWSFIFILFALLTYLIFTLHIILINYDPWVLNW